MPRIPYTDIRWRVQVRDSKTAAWKNKSGLFETRDAAREQAAYLREGRMRDGKVMPGTAYAQRDVRVIKYVKPAAA